MNGATGLELSAQVAAAWPAAQARWAAHLALSPPRLCSEMEALARIDLATRQIELNPERIAALGLEPELEVLLAHEVGHHVRHPGTALVQARLLLLERRLFALAGYSFVNLFTDLLVNERLGRELRAGLIRVYQRSLAAGLSADGARWERDPVFVFYLAIYEALWSLPPGTLLGPSQADFTRAFPRHAADARYLAARLFSLGSNVYAQFLLFLGVAGRYLMPLTGEAPELFRPDGCAAQAIGPEVWAQALEPCAAERRAIERALAERWLPGKLGERLGAEDLSDRIAGLPGFGGADATLVPEVMAAYYRREAERHLFRPPPVRLLGEAVVPVGTEDWCLGEPLAAVDWPASFLARGPLAAAAPLVRQHVAEEEGQEVTLWQGRVEVYLDVSGSMPDPRFAKNPMTLAAQVLVAAAIRAGGAARVVLYSSAAVAYQGWCRSELELSRFLMHYLGGGTNFPFDELAASLGREGSAQPVRVVISDRDFDGNYDAAPRHAALFAEAGARSAAWVLLLLDPTPDRSALYRGAGAQVVAVGSLDDFPRVARELALAVIPEVPGELA